MHLTVLTARRQVVHVCHGLDWSSRCVELDVAARRIVQDQIVHQVRAWVILIVSEDVGRVDFACQWSRKGCLG